MGAIEDTLKIGENGSFGFEPDENDQAALAFLGTAAEADVLKFLRRLPMVAANADNSPICLNDLIYEMKLWPYVKDAHQEIKGDVGVANRILQLSRVYKLAAERMEKATGERRSKERMIDLPTFLRIYSSEGLP